MHSVKADYIDQPKRTFSELGLKQGEIYGVFSCQAYVDDKMMIRQGEWVWLDRCWIRVKVLISGNAVADAAKEIGVKHLVYSSTDTGGVDDTGVAS